MPPKQRKKAPHGKKQKQTSSDSSTLPSPVTETTNYREIHLNEVEALRSIYGDDFEEVETRPSAWHVSIIRVIHVCHLRKRGELIPCAIVAILQCHLQNSPARLIQSRCMPDHAR